MWKTLLSIGQGQLLIYSCLKVKAIEGTLIEPPTTWWFLCKLRSHWSGYRSRLPCRSRLEIIQPYPTTIYHNGVWKNKRLHSAWRIHRISSRFKKMTSLTSDGFPLGSLNGRLMPWWPQQLVAPRAVEFELPFQWIANEPWLKQGFKGGWRMWKGQQISRGTAKNSIPSD